MSKTISQLTQSPYYSLAFNSAIFDGPVRIYFAQHQEAAALQIYFYLQKMIENWTLLKPSFSRYDGSQLFILLYPSPENFNELFPNAKSFFELKPFASDFILGLERAVEMEELATIGQILFENWFQTYPDDLAIDQQKAELSM